jgi:hypothetical protein
LPSYWRRVASPVAFEGFVLNNAAMIIAGTEVGYPLRQAVAELSMGRLTNSSLCNG